MYVGKNSSSLIFSHFAVYSYNLIFLSFIKKCQSSKKKAIHRCSDGEY